GGAHAVVVRKARKSGNPGSTRDEPAYFSLRLWSLERLTNPTEPGDVQWDAVMPLYALDGAPTPREKPLPIRYSRRRRLPSRRSLRQPDVPGVDVELRRARRDARPAGWRKPASSSVPVEPNWSANSLQAVREGRWATRLGVATAQASVHGSCKKAPREEKTKP